MEPLPIQLETKDHTYESLDEETDTHWPLKDDDPRLSLIEIPGSENVSVQRSPRPERVKVVQSKVVKAEQLLTLVEPAPSVQTTLKLQKPKWRIIRAKPTAGFQISVHRA